MDINKKIIDAMDFEIKRLEEAIKKLKNDNKKIKLNIIKKQMLIQKLIQEK